MMLALVTMASAQAAIVPSLNVGSPTVSVAPAGFRYTYTGTVAGDQTMNTGDYLTLFDLTGLSVAAGSITVDAGFSFTTQPLGINPTTPPISPTDSAALLNLTINRTGTALPGLATFGFSFVSTVGTTTDLGLYAAQGTLKSGLRESNQGFVRGPAVIPEPSVTVMLSVAGLLGLGLRTIRRNRSAV